MNHVTEVWKGFPGGSDSKESTYIQSAKTQVGSLGQEDPLEKGMVGKEKISIFQYLKYWQMKQGADLPLSVLFHKTWANENKFLRVRLTSTCKRTSNQFQIHHNEMGYLDKIVSFLLLELFEKSLDDPMK